MSNTDLVQMVSLPLELVGFILTAIEVFAKRINTLAEGGFKKAIVKVDMVWYGRFNSRLALLFLFSFALLSFSSLFLEDLWPNGKDLQIFFILKLVLVSSLLFLNTFLNLRIFLPERPLLALGLTLSILGIAGEIYQFSQIDFS